MTEFTNMLYEMMRDFPELFLNLESHNDFRWAMLSGWLSEQDLDRTVEKSSEAISIFNLNRTLRVRPRKNWLRFMDKRNSSIRRFGPISDLIGFRIQSEVMDIESIVAQILKITSDHNGLAVVKNSISKDIVQFVYVYIPSIEYIIEFQVGHPFAFFTFTVDSHLRDHPKSMVDLWENDFYSRVRAFILGTSEITGLALYTELVEMYKGDVPYELDAIFEKWF